MFDKKELDEIIYSLFELQDSLPKDKLLSSDSYLLLAVDSLSSRLNNRPAIDNLYYCPKAKLSLRIFEVLATDTMKYIFHLSWDAHEFKAFTLSRWNWSKLGYSDKGLDHKHYWDLDHRYSWANNYTSIYDFELKLKEILTQ